MSDLLDGIRFGAVALPDLFESMTPSRAWYDKVHLQDGDGENLYLSQTLSGNSVAGVVADQDKTPEPGNAITVTLKTQATFYQPVPFYTAQNFLIFRHAELDAATSLVLVTAMRKAFEKFSWGYGISMARLSRLHILVPVQTAADGADETDWETMRWLGESLIEGSRARGTERTVKSSGPVADLGTLTFGMKNITELFKPHKGRRLTQAHRVEGDTPFVGGSELNNSITDFSKVGPLFSGNWLTLVYNGSVGRTRYQPAPFYASDDVIALEPLHENAAENALLFCAALIEKVCVSKFSYGAKLNLQRLARTRIPVPVRLGDDGAEVVDWEGMDAVGNSLRARAEAEVRDAFQG